MVLARKIPFFLSRPLLAVVGRCAAGKALAIDSTAVCPQIVQLLVPRHHMHLTTFRSECFHHSVNHCSTTLWC
ncbi:hypothetical protein B0H67DRAFT_582830, partial [Lasiosphaeris hirsuta]